MPIYFVVMASVFDPAIKIHETYDLKGSLYHRKKKLGESIGKDEDWIAAQMSLDIYDDLRREVCAVHEADAMFLTRFKTMDYSVLVGIHRVSEHDPPQRGRGWRDGGGLFSKDGGVIYFVGLIDFSIKYSLKKQTENLMHVIAGRGEQVSCVSQDTYAMRQVRFVREKVVVLTRGQDDYGNRGKLRVRIISAQGLRAADWIGTSDPYVRVTLGLLCRQTPIVKRNCNPKWEVTIDMPVNEEHLSQSLEFAVWDKDETRSLRGTDDFLGRLVVPMQSVLGGPCDLPNASLQDTKQGQLSVHIVFKDFGSVTSFRSFTEV